MAVLLHIEDVITGNTFGERLRNARLLKGLSAREVAKRIDVKYPTYMSYENKNNQPRQDKLVKISDVLNVSIDQLLGSAFTQYGQLEHGQIISLPPNEKEDEDGDTFLAGTDISPILSALMLAITQGFAEYYDSSLQKTLPIYEDERLEQFVIDYVNGFIDTLHEKLIQYEEEHYDTTDSQEHSLDNADNGSGSEQ